MSKLVSEVQVGLEEKLAKNKPLVVKLGFDPTSPDLHLGHYIVLRGAKWFQDRGDTVHIIVGDFTAAIGDPSGRNKLRPPLEEKDIMENAKTYLDQVFLILDETKTKTHRNSSWLNKMDMKTILAIMSSQTVSQILVREDFKNRFETNVPIFMHEMMYPIMQGLDSVAIKADVELGGTDQTFNLMMGRDLQKSKKQEEQSVVTFPLLVGLDGVKKMSKSLGNHIGLLDTPENKFGKIMSISDDTMWKYWDILAMKSQDEIEQMKSSGQNPKNIKMELGAFVVELFHGKKAALEEKERFVQRFTNKVINNIPEVDFEIPEKKMTLTKLMKGLDLAPSITEAGRLIEGNAVSMNSEKVSDKAQMVESGQEFILQVGKLKIRKVKLK